MREDIVSTNPKTPRVVWMLSPPSSKIKRTRVSPEKDSAAQSKGFPRNIIDNIFYESTDPIQTSELSPLFPSTPTLSCIFQNTVSENTTSSNQSHHKASFNHVSVVNNDLLGDVPYVATLSESIVSNQDSSLISSNSSSSFIDEILLCLPEKELESDTSRISPTEDDIYSDPILLCNDALEALETVHKAESAFKTEDQCFNDAGLLFDDLIHVDMTLTDADDIYQDANHENNPGYESSSEDEWFSNASTQIERLLSCPGRDYLRFQVLQPFPENNGIYSLYMKLDFVPDNEAILNQLVFEFWLFSHWIYGESDQICSLKQNDIVNLIGKLHNHIKPSRLKNHIFVDLTNQLAMNSILMIVHPDLLITGTSLSDAFSCMRRSVISILYPGKTSLPQYSDFSDDLYFPDSWITGNILHELFQLCLTNNNFDIKFISSIIPSITRKHIETISMNSRVNIKQSQFHDLIRSYVPSMIKWHNHWSNRNGSISVTRVHDIEETVWSVKFGLKGKIDATLSIECESNNTIQVPLELKTGKRPSSVCHRAQTLLYSLMLHSKRGKPFDFNSLERLVGLLFYLSKSCEASVNMDIIYGKSQEIIDILRTRNRVASYLIHKGSKLPDMLTDERSYQCETCYARSQCIALKNVEENEENEEITFFKFWNEFISREENIAHNERTELWKLSSEKRKRLGRCINKMKLLSCEEIDSKNRTSFGSFNSTLIYEGDGPLHLITDTQMLVFDPIIVSADDDLFPLCETTIISIGYILSMTRDTIVLLVDRQLDHKIKYRIDKDEQLSGFGTQRSTLLSSSFVSRINNSNHDRISRLVVHMERPRWHDLTNGDLICSLDILNQLTTERPYLNQDQHMILKKSLLARDYHLIAGIPGAGKSTIIAILVELLVRCGKTVLLCSYTHNAVDIVLSKLAPINGRDIYWRIGSASRIGRNINQENCLAYALQSMEDKDDLIVKTRELWESRPVVACTALCIYQNVPIIQYRSSFDYCIIDEATQISVPIILGSLQISNTWIMVGDENQLPPMSRSVAVTLEREPKAEQIHGSLSVTSLFSILSSKWNEFTSKLTYQYRMNEKIMNLSNNLVYNNEMKCGSIEVANTRIPFVIPDSSTCFERCLLSMELVFIDCNYPESVVSQLVINTGQVRCISYIVDLFRRTGYCHKDPSNSYQITILTPYRAQAKILSSALNNVHVSTIDKYQGKESEIVIVSFVRSNDGRNVGSLLELWQRTNVAITRAKKQLIMVGSEKTLSSNDFLNRMIKYCKDNQHFITMNQDIGNIYDDISVLDGRDYE